MSVSSSTPGDSTPDHVQVCVCVWYGSIMWHCVLISLLHSSYIPQLCEEICVAARRDDSTPVPTVLCVWYGCAHRAC